LQIKCSSGYSKVLSTVQRAELLSKDTVGSNYIAKELENPSSSDDKTQKLDGYHFVAIQY